MDYSEKERREHIRELQQYLYNISLMIKSIPTVIPDGFFGEKTEKAVIAFQQEYGLPVTGEVDKKTWDTVIVIYKHLFESPPEKIDIFPEKEMVSKMENLLGSETGFETEKIDVIFSGICAKCSGQRKN